VRCSDARRSFDARKARRALDQHGPLVIAHRLALGDEPGEQALVFVPRDTEMVVDPAGNAAVATLEDARSWIGMMIGDRGRTIDPDIAVYVLGLATRFIPDAAMPDEILWSLGLDPVRVAKTVRELGDAFPD